jgi:predicted enzyme related to lactoylglutathione lyase
MGVLGLGGVFFKSPDPARLRAWYARWLGLAVDGDAVALPIKSMPVDGYAVWSPFAASTDYFAPSRHPFMINFVVDDLDGMLAQIRASGAHVVDRVDDYDYGRFGWFVDPDGNKVELWQPRRK